MAKLALPIETDSIPWPKKGDRLLRSADDWNGTVSFSDHPVARDVHIWSGYMRAGSILIEACERDPFDRPDVIYPIFYSYRHGLELAMKWIVNDYGTHAGVVLPERNHNLWKIWQDCRSVIVNIGAADSTGDLPVIEQHVKDFHDLDGAGLSFRYSVDKNRKLIKLPDFTIDLVNLRNIMSGVSNYFDAVDAYLNDVVSIREY